MGKNLIVFVHGLGANDDDWWGSTKDVLKLDKDLSGNFDLNFFQYNTEKFTPPFNGIFNKFGFGSSIASLKDIGGQLVTELNHNTNNYDSIKLFGHSMGGLVISAALHKLKIENKIFDKITDVAMCGTPLGGSNVATTISNIFKLGSSRHTRSLRVNSQEIHSIVNVLPQLISLDPSCKDTLLTFFKIIEDEVVSEDDERYGIFKKDIANGKATTIDLTGRHSLSVRNLSSKHNNYKAIKNWILNNRNNDSRLNKIDFTKQKHIVESIHPNNKVYTNKTFNEFTNDQMIKIKSKNSIEYNFCISERLITKKTYHEIINEESDIKNGKKAITNISWIDAIRFCNLLSEKFDLGLVYHINNEEIEINMDSNGFRLPNKKELKILYNNKLVPILLDDINRNIHEWGNESKAGYQRICLRKLEKDNLITLKTFWHNQNLRGINIGFRVSRTLT